jgi:hypothetical protein
MAAIPAIGQQADTIPMRFYVKDSTTYIIQRYKVADPETDDTTLLVKTSNEYVQILDGYMINGEYQTIFYKPIDLKFKIINLEEREVK